MRHFKIILLVTFTMMSFTAHADKPKSLMVKKEREDFGALIVDGLESQHALRKELRRNVGLTEVDEHWAKEIREKGRVVVGSTEGESVIAPTTTYVQKEKSRISYDPEALDRRIADEIRSLEH